MTIIANGNEPFDRFFANIPFCISFVMNLSSTSAAFDYVSKSIDVRVPCNSLDAYLATPYGMRLQI